MSNKTVKIAGTILVTALLAGGSTNAVAAAQGPVETCVVQAVREAPDLEGTVNHCYWDHWEQMAEYN